jgi:predicted nucleic acid-binding protein
MREYSSNMYLDTSALVKRYVYEPGSTVIDKIFRDAYRGENIISFSYWNIGEAAVVFDKYERILKLNAKELLKNMIREIKTLRKLHRLKVIEISPTIIRNAIKLILRHHIYIADAIQVVSAKLLDNVTFVTSDKKLADIAKKEGLEILLAG